MIFPFFPIASKEHLLFALYNYRNLDMSVQSDRQKLIDSFVNSIYLYDDHFIITFNYKNTSKKVSLKEINSSSLTSSTPPKGKGHHEVIFSFWLISGGNRTGPQARPIPLGYTRTSKSELFRYDGTVRICFLL